MSDSVNQKSLNSQQQDESSISSEMSLKEDTKLSQEGYSNGMKTEDLLSTDLKNSLDISSSSKQSFATNDSISEDAFQKSYDEMTSKLVDYYQSEFEESGKDFQLLRDMNENMNNRFGEMFTKCQDSGDCLHQLNLDLSAVQPYLHKLDIMEESLKIFEEKVHSLVQYTSELEAKFEKKEKS